MSSENEAVNEIMWKNTAPPGRLQKAIEYGPEDT